MSAIMDALGVGPELTFEGKVYRLKPLTLIHYALFSAWLERRAWEAVERAESILSAKSYDKALAAVARECSEGKYDFGSDSFAAAAKSMEGLKYLTLLSLKDGHEGVDEEFVDRLFDQKMKRIIGLMNQANDTKADA